MPDHISEIIRKQGKRRWKETEAAALVGVSHDTLRRWRRGGRFTPSDSMKVGNLTVYLYTGDDIDRLKELKKG